jgi:hypothetical protein
MSQINKRLKKIIFNKLYKELSHVEIIPYKSSLWFIDRNEKYWYLEFQNSGKLWWRNHFFTNFFRLFSMGRSEFQPIICEWVEEVLNSNVVSTHGSLRPYQHAVEEVLNSNVVSTEPLFLGNLQEVEEVLNSKVISTKKRLFGLIDWWKKKLIIQLKKIRKNIIYL